MSTTVTLKRDCHALVIPSGETYVLRAGTPVVVTQSLGGSFTVQSPAIGGLFRIADRDADALGLSPTAPAAPAAPKKAPGAGPLSEEAVWDQLRSCYDPEIPVNIVDLGLVYDLKILPRSAEKSRVEVKMTLTAPGCGMGPSIAADAQQKIAALPGVAEAEVAVVWDPPWSAEMMTDEGKRKLGIV
jgi:probable FeS assembly SUF system protein SufT